MNTDEHGLGGASVSASLKLIAFDYSRWRCTDL